MSSDIDIPVTWIAKVAYEWLSEPEAPPVMVQKGGTRSGKTYNACAAWAGYLRGLDEPETLSIVRATGPALKASVIKDMIDVLRRMELYDPQRHHKQDMVITLPNGSEVDYFPTDDEQKLHGRSRDHLWANEANEVSAEEWRQLEMRTRHRKMLDFNPSFGPSHWINEKYAGSDDSIWYTSTYTDNPFITEEQLRTIEALKQNDPWAWKVYGLGEMARPAAAIYHDVEPLREWTHEGGVLGLDFGYNDPMSLARVKRVDKEGRPELHVWQLLHESHLTTSDLVDMLPQLGVGKNEELYCDSAEPDRIEVLQRAGYNAKGARKGRGSVKAGIDFCKQHKICIGGPAGDVARQEFQNYRWKRHRSSGDLLDEPEDGDDHAPDSVRYPVMEKYMIPASDRLTIA